jgi:DNA-binding MarR family transcriptional regulator
MLKNIDTMVVELSKLEVSARRTRHMSYTNEQREKINKAIDHLEKLLLMAKLMS